MVAVDEINGGEITPHRARRLPRQSGYDSFGGSDSQKYYSMTLVREDWHGSSGDPTLLIDVHDIIRILGPACGTIGDPIGDLATRASPEGQKQIRVDMVTHGRRREHRGPDRPSLLIDPNLQGGMGPSQNVMDVQVAIPQ